MNISWLLGSEWDQHVEKAQRLKSVGPIWGPVQTWRDFGTDNVICYDLSQASNLIKRNFQQSCNFYIHEDFYSQLERPEFVNLFGGKFDADMFHKEVVICSHLAASTSDIILMLGVELDDKKLTDKYDQHRYTNYFRGIRKLISESSTQWVCIDKEKTNIDDSILALSNFSVDSLENVETLLKQ